MSERCNTLALKNCLDQLSTHHCWIDTQVRNYKPMCFEYFSSIWYQFCIKILRKQTTEQTKNDCFSTFEIKLKTKALQELVFRPALTVCQIKGSGVVPKDHGLVKTR